MTRWRYQLRQNVAHKGSAILYHIIYMGRIRPRGERNISIGEIFPTWIHEPKLFLCGRHGHLI